MISSLKKTVATGGARGLFDGISGTWLRQMTYSICRFWAYDQSKKYLGADSKSPPWKLALAGSMGQSFDDVIQRYNANVVCLCSWRYCWMCGQSWGDHDGPDAG